MAPAGPEIRYDGVRPVVPGTDGPLGAEPLADGPLAVEPLGDGPLGNPETSARPAGSGPGGAASAAGGGPRRPPAMAYRRAFEAEGDARILIEVVSGPEFRCVDANEGAARFLGVPRDRLIGETPSSALEPEMAARATALMLRALEGTAQADARRQAADGGVRDYTVLARPVADARGRIRWIETVVQDITDALRLRRERDDARSLLASVFSAAQAGIIVADDSGRVIEVNDALLRTARATREAVVGRHFRCLVPPEDRPRAEALFPRLAAGEVSGIGEWRLHRHDGGDAVPIVASGSVISRSDGSRCVVATVTDITEQKRLEQALRSAGDAAARANLAKNSFLASMSHELRTPLNAILGFTEILRGELFGPLGAARYVEYADDIHTSAEHLLSLVNDLLDLSRIEAGALELDESRIDPRQILGAARRMLSETAERRAIGLEFTASEDLPVCRGDERMLRQVMINLVGNALKYTDRNGRVAVGAGALRDGSMLFLIRDTGPGIPVDRHGQALAPYGRVGPTEASSGSGLGLPLAKAMVERHGGHLLLNSDAGAGTVMIVLLPAERTAAPRGPGPDPDAGAAAVRRLAGIEITPLPLAGPAGIGGDRVGAALAGLPDGVIRLDPAGRVRGAGSAAGQPLDAYLPGIEDTPVPDAVYRLGEAAVAARGPVDLIGTDAPPEHLFDVSIGSSGFGMRMLIHLRALPRRNEVLMFVRRLNAAG